MKIKQYPTHLFGKLTDDEQFTLESDETMDGTENVVELTPDYAVYNIHDDFDEPYEIPYSEMCPADYDRVCFILDNRFVAWDKYNHEDFYNEFGDMMRERFAEALVRGYSLDEALEEAVEHAEGHIDTYPDVDFLYDDIGGRDEFKKRMQVKMVVDTQTESDLLRRGE